ncbi:MAG: aquaporin [Opitutia bacterium]|jgi:glycerol uptake facilitator-like aquaporin
MSPGRRALAEFLGTAALLATVVGSGHMGQSLAGGNLAVALLANSLATAAVLYVLITAIGPVSGAHLNPVVSVMAWRDGDLPARLLPAYVAAQVSGAVAGAGVAHLLFGLPLLQVSSQTRSAPNLWLSELVATVALLVVVRSCRGAAAGRAPALVALTVGAGYWATSSTFFANPAATLARTLSDTFAGIRPADAPAFVLAQLIGLGLVLAFVRRMR